MKPYMIDGIYYFGEYRISEFQALYSLEYLQQQIGGQILDTVPFQILYYNGETHHMTRLSYIKEILADYYSNQD